MYDFIRAEVSFFLTSFVWGVVLFFVYDLLRIIRNVIRHAKVVTAIEDIGFWVTAGILIFRMMYEMNDGTIRYYAVISVVLGMKLYQILLSRLIVKYGSKLFLWLKKIIQRFLRWLASPLFFLWKQIKRFIHFIGGKVNKRVAKIKNAYKKRLKIYQEKVKIKKKAKLEKQLESIEEPLEPEIPRGILQLVTEPQKKGDQDETLSAKKKKKRS